MWKSGMNKFQFNATTNLPGTSRLYLNVAKVYLPTLETAFTKDSRFKAGKSMS